MDELIRKLEQATVGGRELDAAICFTLMGWGGKPEAFTEVIHEGLSRDGWRNGPAGAWDDELPRYTTSLDAALTLVPEGWNRRLSEDDNGRWWAELRQGRETSYGRVELAGKCHTPAIAFCVAALKARLACQPA